MLKYLFVSGLIAFTSLGASPISDIDQQISDMKAKLDQTELQAMNREVESQSDFIADWPAYGVDAESVKKNEELAQQLRKQINELEKQKLELLRKKAATK